MEKITSSLFQKSVFNIGAGKDLNPLIRFAHYSDVFIYTNLYLDFDEIFSWYKNNFMSHPDFELVSTEVIEDDAYQHVFEPGANQGLFVRPVYPFDAEFFMRNYTHVFQHATRELNWLAYFEVRFKPLNKILKLYYCNGEGLATYLRLSDSGKYACRVMVTVQTGVLEYPKQEMDKFFARYTAPKIWVRGYEPAWERFGRALFASGFFGKEGMGFNHHWTVGKYNPNTLDTRFCKGFITNDTYQALALRPKVEEWNANHTLVRGSLQNSPMLKDGDWLVLSTNLFRFPETLPAKVEVIYWENLVGSKRWYGTEKACSSGAREQLAALGKKLAGIQLDPDQRVHVLPFCLESEMEVYRSEMESLPFKTVTYGMHPLDFTSWDELEGACAHFAEANIDYLISAGNK